MNRITVRENIGLVNISVERTGDISSSATVHCITQDGTAVSQEDYQERYKTRKDSLMHFNPGQKVRQLCVHYLLKVNENLNNA